MGFSGTAAVNLSGIVTVLEVNTKAYIGSSAKVNCTLVASACTNPGAGSDQSVKVVAANQYYELGVAATIAVSGGAGVGAGVAVRLVHLTTEAYIDSSAMVKAEGNVEVRATGKDMVVSVVAGAGGGTVGIAGMVSVTLLETDTKAYTGTGVTIEAQDNVLFLARDDTKLILITASLAGGFVGVAVAVGVASVDKDTEAYIGGGASKVDAKALNSGMSLGGIYNGVSDSPGSPTATIRGLAIQATSTENVFGLAASAGGGFVGVAGGIGVTLLKVVTKAFVADTAQVNTLGTASTAQAVNVSAADRFKSLTVGGGIAGGFVGVAVAVSVWTVGTATTATYNDGAGGPDRGTWCGTGPVTASCPTGGTYAEGDVVSYGGKKWGSKDDNNQNHTPSAGSSFWLGETDALTAGGNTNDGAGAPAGDADTTASGNDVGAHDGTDGGPGYKSITSGTSNGGSNPTDAKISNAGSGANTKIAAKAPGGSLVTGAIANSAVPLGTSAYIGGTVVAGGGVHVRAKDNLVLNGIAGAASAGLVGIGGSVLVANVQTNTDAGIVGTASITAGPSGDITVETIYGETIDPLAFAGTVGAIAIAAQVIVVNADSKQKAHVDTGAQIKRAGAGLHVTANTDRTISALALGGSFGLGGVGASVAVATATGDSEARVDGAVFGGVGSGVSSVVVLSDDPLTATAQAYNVVAGLGFGLGAAVAVAKLEGTTKASFGGTGTVGSGGVSVTAQGSHTAESTTLQVTTGAFAAGVVVAHAENARSTLAELAGSANFSTGGAVAVKGDITNIAHASAPGGSVGGISISVMVPTAIVSGSTRATFDGTVTSSSQITVEAIANNEATATAQIFSVSLGGINGSVATARIDGAADVEAVVGSAASLKATGLIRIEAKLKGTMNKATAKVTSDAFGGIAIGAMIADASVDGGVRAELNGHIVDATTVDVLATSDNHASARVEAVAMGVAFSANIAGADARVDGETEVLGASTGLIHAGNAITLQAKSNNFAEAFSDAATGGILAGFSFSKPSATVNGRTKVSYDGDVTGGTSLTVKADGKNGADATSKAITVGIISAQGGGSEAGIGDGADVQATVGSNADINGLTGKLTVTALSENLATAQSGGDGGGFADIKIIHPNASDDADTTAELLGDVGGTHIDAALGTVGDAGAVEIEVSAHGDDRTVAKVDTFGIGVVAIGASSATALTQPTISATLGSGHVTATNDVFVVADSQTDADAFAEAVSGGVVNIQAELVADARTKPTVSATAQGGFVQAGGTLTLSANHGSTAPELSDGTISSVNTGDNTLTFDLPHGVTTGDTVVYSAPASNVPGVEDGTVPNPNAIGGLGDGRTYGVIVTCGTSCNTLMLGVEFNAAGVVNTAKGALAFSDPHNFETGDRVVYDCNGGGVIGTKPVNGLICGATYYVFKIDEFLIRLSATPIDADGDTVLTFTPSTIIGGNTIRIVSTAGLTEGQAVVYHAPPIVTFRSDMVDITVNGDGQIVRNSSGQIIHSDNQVIYAPGHIFSTGDRVRYNFSGTYDPTPGTDPSDDFTPAPGLDADLVLLLGGGDYGLTNGQTTLYVRVLDGNRIQLADTACHAGFGTFDPTPGDTGNGDENTLCSTNVHVLLLNPDTSTGGLRATHTLQKFGAESIGLVEGNMYFIHKLANGTDFQLQTANGSTVGGLVAKTGNHKLVYEGVATISAGSGTQRLIVDLTSIGLGSPHVLAGIGGPESLLGQSDGIVSGTSTGIGGGLFDLRDATSYVESKPVVSATVGAAKLRGQNIVISAFSGSNVAVASTGEGGGFASFGESNANAQVKNDVTTTIQSGADLFATRDIEIKASGTASANGKGVNATGGLIAGADVDSTLEVGFQIKTLVNGKVVANRTVVVDAAAGLKLSVYAKANSGGLGTDTDANDSSSQGIRIGQMFGALAESRLGADAEIRGATVYISAGVGVEHGLNPANGAVTTDEMFAEAIARSSAHASALGADSDAGAYVTADDTVQVVLETGAEITGDAVTLRASHENINFQADASSSCSCGGGDTDATAKVDYDRDSKVQADDGSVIRTADLLVETYEFWQRLYAHAHRSGGFFDVGDADADVVNTAGRHIVWNADVYLLGEPNPLLIVDSTGTIIAKTYNVTVHASGGGGALGIGGVIPVGQTIVIDPIIYDELPSALFVANHVDSQASHIDGSTGVFYMQETWDSVTILNSSDRPILFLGTNDPQQISINTLNAAMSQTPEAIINISVDQGPSIADPLSFQFDVKHIYPATDLRIESIRGPPATGFDLTIEGDIWNIVGSTIITNDRGSIFVGTDSGTETFYSNKAFLDSELGSIGTIPNPVRLYLFQITHTGVDGVAAVFKDAVLNGEAGLDMYLELTVDRRSSTTAALSTSVKPFIGPLKAGHDLYVKINDSHENTTPATVGDIDVDIYTPNNLPPAGGSGHVLDESVPTTNHFRPDSSPDNPNIVGCGTTQPCVILVAFGNVSSLVNADYTFTDLRAGHNIGVHHPSTATAITYLAYTDVDATWNDDETNAVFGSADNSGKIDMSTNGSIHVIEQSAKGDLRVGHIHATGVCTGGAPCPAGELAANVTLDSPRKIIDAELEDSTNVAQDDDDDTTCVDAYDVHWGFDCAAGTPTGVDVTARNITMTAGDNGLGQAGSKSGTGGIGMPNNFLEINVDAAGGSLGVVKAFDTAADDDKTFGIYLDEVAGDMKVHTVETAGDTCNVSGLNDGCTDTGNVSLRTRAGSIVDARNNGAGDLAADVLGQTIDIDAHGGSIGQFANDLEIDSSRGSFFPGFDVPGLAAIADDVALEARDNIYLTEVDSYLRLVFAHATLGDIRITVRESSPDIDEDLYLIKNGSVRFAEDDSTVPGNDPDALRSIPNGMVFAEVGNVRLQVGDDVFTHQNTRILANGTIDIFGDWSNADTGGTPDEFGSTMIIRGEVTADCVVTSAGDFDQTGYPVAICTPNTNPNPGAVTNIWGHTDVDIFTFGDPTGANPCPGATIRGCSILGSDGYFKIGSKTIVHGAPTLDSTTADGEDEFFIWYMQSADVLAAPAGLASGPGAGHSLTLDGQGETDYYTIYTLGSHGDRRNYVINILDTGLANQGVDEAAIYGWDELTADFNGYVPGTLTRNKTDDIFLLRATKCIDTQGDTTQPYYSNSELDFSLADHGTPTTCDSPNETADHPAFVALLAGDDSPDGGLSSYRSRTVGDEVSSMVQRINYDTALNGRLSVYGMGGNDAFFVDDNSAITTLDGGAGFDLFQVGQIFGFKRDAEEGFLLPQDTFPVLVATTRGWLSPGIHAPLVATGGTGNDEFIVYANQAELRLEGDDDNDLFTVRAFALAAVCDTDADGNMNDMQGNAARGCDFGDINLEADPDTGLYPVDADNSGTCTAAENPGYDGEGWTGFRKDNNHDGVCNKADAHITGAQTFTAAADPTKWEDDVIPLDEDGVARPIIGLGFSTARPLDIRAGGGEDEVSYNVNAPVSVDGGTGFDKLVILGTEFADDIVISVKGIFGAGLNVRYDNIEVVEVDGLEGDDEFFIISTKFGTAYRVIGGLGSDTINIASDVTEDIVTRELEGISGTIDARLTSQLDKLYDGLPVDGIDYNLATPDLGAVIITESGSGTTVREGGLASGPTPDIDSYAIRLASDPGAGKTVYVTISAARSPQEEADDTFSNPEPIIDPNTHLPISDSLSDGPADTVWLCTGTAPTCKTQNDFKRFKIVNGVVVDENNRALVFTFTR